MNLGIVLQSLSGSDCAYSAIKMVNGLVGETKVSPAIFFNNISPPVMKPLCMSMNVNSISSYSGTLIATDFVTASIIHKNNAKCDKWLYLWNIEWLMASFQYIPQVDMLNDFSLIIRDESMRSVVNNYCGQNPQVMENFNWEELKKCLTLKKNI